MYGAAQMSPCRNAQTVTVKAAAQRGLEIRRILDARFSLGALEQWKHNDAAWWSSKRNDMGRGIYGQAMRQLQRLEAAADEVLDAELAAIAR
jgi:hypothetical protein